MMYLEGETPFTEIKEINWNIEDKVETDILKDDSDKE